MINSNELSNSHGKITLDRFSTSSQFKLLSPCDPNGPCTGECGHGGLQALDPMPNDHVSLVSARFYIEQLDFQYIVTKMCSPTYPLQRWTVPDALHCAKLYKNYLFLLKKYLPDNLVPGRAIDEFWHNHILHTKNYFQDCHAIFGHYLHHEPAVAGEDSQRFVQGYLKTKQFYLVESGVSLDWERLY